MQAFLDWLAQAGVPDALLFLLLVGFLVVAALVARAIQKREDVQRILSEWDWLLEQAEAIIVRIAFVVDPEEQLAYEEEALQTGRDVRLVRAYRELMDLAEERGIKIDLAAAIGLAEQVVQRLKLEGILQSDRHTLLAVEAETAVPEVHFHFNAEDVRPDEVEQYVEGDPHTTYDPGVDPDRFHS